LGEAQLKFDGSWKKAGLVMKVGLKVDGSWFKVGEDGWKFG